MIENIYTTEAERKLMQLIDENPAVFAEGLVDWNHVRDYAIQTCVNHNMAQGEKTPVRRACIANNVNRTYYYKSNIAKKRFI